MENRRYGCRLCGAKFRLGDVFLTLGAKRICTDCADGISTAELMELTGAASTRAMLTALGFEKDFI